MRRCNLALLAYLTVFGAPFGAEAFAQCILANPSFEIGGSGGAVFGGWNQFGVVSNSSDAFHGSAAAVVSGPDGGGGGVSGYWQQQDCSVGERWEVTVQVRHPSAKPLTGQCVAIVNVEWRDAAGDLIAYESHTAADAASPTDEYIGFAVTSGPAPAGTVGARLLLGVLQSPTAPSPDIIYDQVTFSSASYPTLDDVQWYDFPSGRTVDFAGRIWRVKGPGYYGPGPNHFSNAADQVWVDAQDRLHMTIAQQGGTWYSTEIALAEPLGYGDYIFTTQGRLDLLDVHAVLGMFIWQYGPCWDPAYLWWNPYNEFDIEFSRWGIPGNDLGQFVAQPWDWPGNLSRFDLSFSDGELTSHAFRWLPDRVECRSWRGGPQDEAPAALVHSWTYSGPHVPRPVQPRVHINLWQVGGSPTMDQEVIIDDFTFVPEGAASPVPDGTGGLRPAQPAARLFAATPNPLNPATTLRFALDRSSVTELAVYDLAGRRVRVLVDEFLTAGEHEAIWDGCDDSGNEVASGVYLYVLRAGDVLEGRRLTLVK